MTEEEQAEIAIMVGRLSKEQGINGFVTAEIGHPVFEYKDRYIIYLESETPQKISGFGIETTYQHFKVAIPYYKNTLKPVIDFL